jgi:PAS domain-containing protein
VAQGQVIALLRRCFFDASLALDAYGHADDATYWRQFNRLETPSQEPSHPGPSVDLKTSSPSASAPGDHASIRLTEVNAQDRKRFIGLSEADLSHLHHLQPLIAARTPAILEEFYTFLSSAPETAAMVPPDITERLKQQVASYWRELADGEFDRPYAASRMRIGVIHEKIGLSPEWYMAGLARQLGGFIQAIDPTLPEAPELIQALVRASLFDVSFVIDAYMEARVSRLFRSEGYAQQLLEGLASAVAVIDGRDRLISANRTLLAMVNADPALLYLMSVERAIPIPELGHLLKEAREGDQPRVVGPGHLGGRKFRISVTRLTHQADASGNAALVMDDITELQRIAEDMDRQSDRNDHLGDIVGSVIWEMDLDTWTISNINQGTLDLTGTRSVRYLGRAHAWTEQIADADRERFRQKGLALQPGEKAVIEYRMQRLDGQEIWVRSNLGRSRGRTDHRIFGATTDISASRRNEALRLEGMAPHRQRGRPHCQQFPHGRPRQHRTAHHEDWRIRADAPAGCGCEEHHEGPGHGLPVAGVFGPASHQAAPHVPFGCLPLDPSQAAVPTGPRHPHPARPGRGPLDLPPGL